MNSNPPKVSFIPKNSFSREREISNRPRPKSFIAAIAIGVFIITTGVYGGTYFYNDLLAKEIEKKAIEIKAAQDTFTQSPEIERAKVFNARAGLARQLLDSHIVVSPIFDFLSQNTVSTIRYESFTFKQEKGVDSLKLKGEAPSYATLANQLDIIKKKNKEISSYSLRDVNLTKFGSVTFTLELFFMPGYLHYTNNDRRSADSVDLGAQMIVGTTTSKTKQQTGTSSLQVPPSVQSESTTLGIPPTQVPQVAVPGTIESAPEKVGVEPQTGSELLTPEPTNRSIWSWFKFW